MNLNGDPSVASMLALPPGALFLKLKITWKLRG